MATTPPVIDFRDPTNLANPLASYTLVGTGVGGSIPAGSTSTPYTLRIYNNYAGAAGIADATNCVLAAYDSGSTRGGMTTPAVLGTWLQVEVINYNGVTVGADTQFYAIGGTVKHSVPTNTGTIAGSAANFITVTVQVVIPANASGANINQGLWLECNYNL
jgi:hypothetical protein